MLDERFNAISKKFDTNNLSNLSDQELIDGQKEILNAVGQYRSLELTVKQLSNSIYGAFGTNANRYFLQALAEDICAEGQYYIKLMDKVQNEHFTTDWLNETEFVEELKQQEFGHIIPDTVKKPKLIDGKDWVIYVDTDSTYSRGDYILESLNVDYENEKPKDCTRCLEYIFEHKMKEIFDTTLEDIITKRHGTNVMDFELELIGGKGIFIEKKKYIITTLLHDGEYVGHKGWFKSTGIEIQQSGSSKLVHNVIKSFINAIFTKWKTLDDKTFFAMCASVRHQLKDAKTDDLAKISKIKKFSEYIIDDKETVQLRQKASAQVKGAARYNHLIYKNNLQNKYGYIKDGMRCKWFYDKNNNTFAYPDDIWPYEIAPEISIDTQLEKLIFNPVKRFVSGLFKADMQQMGNNELQFSFRALKKHKK